MYRIEAFNNAKEFNRIFGMVQHDNGKVTRRNTILLSFYKSKSVWDYCKKHDEYLKFFSITNMVVLKNILMQEIRSQLLSLPSTWRVELMGNSYYSTKFSTDEFNGLPSNGDVGFVRYVTHEKNREGKVYKMRSGKFFKRIILETEIGNAIPQQVLNWLCEEFASDWASYVTMRMPHFTLNVDDDFERIYSYERENGCTCDFNSCMMDDDQYYFYEDCVNAKAASLVNDSGRVVARCVIFNEVFDEEGNVWRLAERQYAECGSELYKRCLVDALINAGLIDGYKKVGVDCHSTRLYVDVNGESLEDKRFYIKCDLDFSKNCDEARNVMHKRILSYQDSFKYYDTKLRKAFNYELRDCVNVRHLDSTCSYLEGSWDEYHSELCANICWVHFKQKTIRCDCGRMEDFVKCDGEYFHKSEVEICPVCGNAMPSHEVYPEFTNTFRDTHVCSDSCKRSLRNKYFKEHCFFDDLAQSYVNKEEDKPISMLYVGFGVDLIRGRESRITEYIDIGKFCLIDGIPVYNTFRKSEEQIRIILEAAKQNERYYLNDKIEIITSENEANGINICDFLLYQQTNELD